MGEFISFYLPFSSKLRDSLKQAQVLINEAKELINKGAPGVAITYSANYAQTVKIRETYEAGEWYTHTSGLHQADVMREMEALMASEETSLQGLVQIAPITTITYTDYNGQTLDDVIKSDFDNVVSLLKKGWTVLGWKNQDSIPKYAVGGKISNMTSAQNKRIQNAFLKLSKEYPERK